MICIPSHVRVSKTKTFFGKYAALYVAMLVIKDQTRGLKLSYGVKNIRSIPNVKILFREKIYTVFLVICNS